MGFCRHEGKVMIIGIYPYGDDDLEKKFGLKKKDLAFGHQPSQIKRPPRVKSSRGFSVFAFVSNFSIFD